MYFANILWSLAGYIENVYSFKIYKNIYFLHILLLVHVALPLPILSSQQPPEVS